MYGGGENSNQQTTNLLGGIGLTPNHAQQQQDVNTVNKINNIIGDKHKSIETKINNGVNIGSQIVQSNKFLMVFPAFKVLFLIVFLVFFYRRIIDLVTFFDVSDIHANFYITWITFLLVLWVLLPANRSNIL